MTTPTINRDAQLNTLTRCNTSGRRVGNPANESMFWSAA